MLWPSPFLLHFPLWSIVPKYWPPSHHPSCVAPFTISFIRLLCWLLLWSNHIWCRVHIKMGSHRQQLLILAENRFMVRSALFLQQLCCLSAAPDAASLPHLYHCLIIVTGMTWSTTLTVNVFVCVHEKIQHTNHEVHEIWTKQKCPPCPVD